MRQRERSARNGRRAPIAAIQQAAGGTSGAIGEIGHTIAQLSLIAAEVAAAAEQQGQASHEIARAIAGTAADAPTVSLSIAEVRTAAASNEERSDEVRSGAKGWGMAAPRCKSRPGRSWSGSMPHEASAPSRAPGCAIMGRAAAPSIAETAALRPAARSQ